MAEGQSGLDVLAVMRDMRDQILREMGQGFKGVHHRQDVTNGRILKLEDGGARTDERLQVLEEERDAFHQHRRASDPLPSPVTPAQKDPDDRRLTQRDARLVGLGAIGAMGLVKLLPWLVALAQAAKP